MKSLQKNKTTWAAIIIFLFAITVYNLFLKSDSVPVAASDTQTVGSDLVELFNSLQLVTLNQDLFTTPVYKKLSDFSAEVPLQPVGRNNPFDIIGR